MKTGFCTLRVAEQGSLGSQTLQIVHLPMSGIVLSAHAHNYCVLPYCSSCACVYRTLHGQRQDFSNYNAIASAVLCLLVAPTYHSARRWQWDWPEPQLPSGEKLRASAMDERESGLKLRPLPRSLCGEGIYPQILKLMSHWDLAARECVSVFA